MLTAPTVMAVLVPLAWCVLALGRGWFWRVTTNCCPATVMPQDMPRVAAVVPARNEAGVIAAALRSLFAQRGVEMQVYLVDDASTDGTADVAREAASQTRDSARLTIVAGQPLPPGWTGKQWAVEQGVARARHENPEWLLLADADVAQGSHTVATLTSIAQEGGYDLVSFMVRLHCESSAEKLLIPAFVYFFFKLYPPAWVRDRRRATAGAAGGCLLVRSSALERAGGISAIRGALIDDCALAALIKKNGGRVWLGLGGESHSLRRYPRFADLEHMIARTAFYQLHHSTLLLLGTLAGMTLLYLGPPLLTLTGRFLPATLGGVAWAIMTLTYLDLVRYYSLSAWWALTLPAAALFYLGATVHSAFKYWTGSGGEWKGRTQDLD